MPRRTTPALVTLGLSLVLALGALQGSVAGSATAATPASASPARTITITTTQFQNRVLSLVNARRARVGCPALRPNAYLNRAARIHNNLMVTAHNLSHQLPRESSLAPRIVRAGYTRWRYLAENLAWGGTSPVETYRMWMASSGHRTNIQHCASRDVGVAVAYSGGRPWVTMDFGRRR
ncbi:MAG: CAP domain-containing protein [Marmoricola sp.]